MEQIKCPICNKDDNKLVWKSKDFRFKISDDMFNIVKCNACGFIYLNPRPDEKDIGVFYPPYFHRQDRSLFYKIIEPFFRTSQKSTVNSIKKFKPSGKILDIGCGNGDFLLAMKEAGYNVWGIEPAAIPKDIATSISREGFFILHWKKRSLSKKLLIS